MNIYQSESFRKSIKRLDEEHLYSLRSWFCDKEQYTDELRLIDIEIERRAKLRRNYDN